MEILRERNEELKEKILNGETEESVAIGAGSYTKSEWSKFLKDFDDAQDMIKQQIREEITKRVEKQEKIEEIEDEKFDKDIDKDIQDKKELEKELLDLGLQKVTLTDHCYIYGLIPATPGYEDKTGV